MWFIHDTTLLRREQAGGGERGGTPAPQAEQLLLDSAVLSVCNHLLPFQRRNI